MALDHVLKGQRVGSWVVLDSTMDKVLAVGDSPLEAVRKAGIKPEPVAGKSGGSRPIIVQVPDPSVTTSLY